MSIVQTRHEGYVVQGGGPKIVEKWLDLRCVLKLKSGGFVHRLAVTC